MNEASIPLWDIFNAGRSSVYTQISSLLKWGDPKGALDQFNAIKEQIALPQREEFLKELIDLIGKDKENALPSSLSRRTFVNLSHNLADKINQYAASVEYVAKLVPAKSSEFTNVKQLKIAFPEADVTLLSKLVFAGSPGDSTIGRIFNHLYGYTSFFKKNESKVKLKLYQAIQGFLWTNNTEKLISLIENEMLSLENRMTRKEGDKYSVQTFNLMVEVLKIKNKQALRTPCFYFLEDQSYVNNVNIAFGSYVHVCQSASILHHDIFSQEQSLCESILPFVEFSEGKWESFLSIFENRSDLDPKFKMHMRSYYENAVHRLKNHLFNALAHYLSYSRHLTTHFTSVWINSGTGKKIQGMGSKAGDFDGSDEAFLRAQQEPLRISFAKQEVFCAVFKNLCRILLEEINCVRNASLFLLFGHLKKEEVKISTRSDDQISEMVAAFEKEFNTNKEISGKYKELEEDKKLFFENIQQVFRVVKGLNLRVDVYSNFHLPTFKELEKFCHVERFADSQTFPQQIMSPEDVVEMVAYQKLIFLDESFLETTKIGMEICERIAEGNADLTAALEFAKRQKKILKISEAAQEHVNVLKTFMAIVNDLDAKEEILAALQRLANQRTGATDKKTTSPSKKANSLGLETPEKEGRLKFFEHFIATAAYEKIILSNGSYTEPKEDMSPYERIVKDWPQLKPLLESTKGQRKVLKIAEATQEDANILKALLIAGVDSQAKEEILVALERLKKEATDALAKKSTSVELERKGKEGSTEIDSQKTPPLEHLIETVAYKKIIFSDGAVSRPKTGVAFYQKMVESRPELKAALERAKRQKKILIIAQATHEHVNVLNTLLFGGQATTRKEILSVLERLDAEKARSAAKKSTVPSKKMHSPGPQKPKGEGKEERLLEETDQRLKTADLSKFLLPICSSSSSVSSSSSSSSSSSAASLIKKVLVSPPSVEKTLKEIALLLRAPIEAFKNTLCSLRAKEALCNAEHRIQDLLLLQQKLFDQVERCSAKEELFSTIVNLAVEGSLAIEQLLRAKEFNELGDGASKSLTHNLSAMICKLPVELCSEMDTISGTHRGEISSRRIALFSFGKIDQMPLLVDRLLAMSFDFVHATDSAYSQKEIISQAADYSKNIVKAFLALCLDPLKGRFKGVMVDLEALNRDFTSEMMRVSALESTKVPSGTPSVKLFSKKQTEALAALERVNKCLDYWNDEGDSEGIQLANLRKNLLCRLTAEVSSQGYMSSKNIRAHYTSVLLLNQTLADEFMNIYLSMHERMPRQEFTHDLAEKLHFAKISLKSFSASSNGFIARSKEIRNFLRYESANKRLASIPDFEPIVRAMTLCGALANAKSIPSPSESESKEEESKSLFEEQGKGDEGFEMVKSSKTSRLDKELKWLQDQIVQDIQSMASFIETLISQKL